MNQGEEKKAQLIEAQRKHLEAASNAREYMNQCINLARKSLSVDSSIKLQNVKPLTGPAIAHYGFDFAQQLHYPMTPAARTYLLQDPTKVWPLWCLLRSIPHAGEQLIDEACATSKGANAVVSYLHHFLEYYGWERKNLFCTLTTAAVKIKTTS
ncbi:hypothetical protein EB796_002940 [Bugula neritina]|uniref:Uncharacterized protein n=1 Tax=Bugula neritina TaxID=10212 RepID=A0A7J7KL72_BUGNE|nr:hypothetical protein EB796_002940 [Bugula neritina]